MAADLSQRMGWISAEDLAHTQKYHSTWNFTDSMSQIPPMTFGVYGS